MNPAALRDKLIAVLTQIQVDSGLACPVLTGATKPIGTLPEFTSKVWPVATTILATEIGATIPNDVNIFIDETTKLARSIDEISLFVGNLLKKQAAKETAAA